MSKDIQTQLLALCYEKTMLPMHQRVSFFQNSKGISSCLPFVTEALYSSYIRLSHEHARDQKST